MGILVGDGKTEYRFNTAGEARLNNDDWLGMQKENLNLKIKMNYELWKKKT